MEIVLSETALKHIDYWKKTNNVKVQKRIIELKDAILSNPYNGIGNPEPLKHELSGKWSRRINKEHRFIYHIDIENNTLYVLSLKGHY
ncbi:MAG: Txe/YoeB family addiction module toxin [Bacteroidota bacterium]